MQKRVHQYKEKSRECYITDAEYAAIFAATLDMVREVIKLAYLCCARPSDVLLH